MGFLTPKLAVPIGLFIGSIGLLLAHFHPFGGDALDAGYGLVVGVGFGLTLAGYLKRGRSKAT